MAVDDKQNSPNFYVKRDGRTLAIPVPKLPKGWENMKPEELETAKKEQRKIAKIIDEAIRDALEEKHSEDFFIDQMRLIYRRFFKVFNNIPINRSVVEWTCQYIVRNRTNFTEAHKICSVFRRFLDFLGNGVSGSTGALEPEDFDRFVFHLRKKNVYGSRLMNRAIWYLRSFAHSIEPSGFLVRNLEKEAIDYLTHNPLSLEQLRCVMRVLKREGEMGEQWRIAVLIVLYTVIRPTAACSLRIDQIDFSSDPPTITCRDKLKEVVAPIPKFLLKELKKRVRKLQRRGHELYLTETLRNSNLTTRTRQWNDILHAAGVPMPKLKQKYGPASRFEHSLYDCRHRFCNWVLGLTLSKATTKAITNHDSDDAMRSYLRFNDPFVLKQQELLLNKAPKVF
jgi:integrase